MDSHLAALGEGIAGLSGPELTRMSWLTFALDPFPDLFAAPPGGVSVKVKDALLKKRFTDRQRCVRDDWLLRGSFMRGYPSPWRFIRRRISWKRVIPLESGGSNKWWNFVPTYGASPNHALPRIPGPHARGGALRRTIQRGKKALPPGTTTDLRVPE